MARACRLLIAIAALAPAGCGGDTVAPPPAEPAHDDPGLVHIHGLGVNPRDGALFIATHTGMFRAAAGERRPRRVGDRRQDTMGFTVVGPDHFLGSGHPDARDELPPFLGLIESRDAGETWRPVSLLGEVDFHVLEAAGGHVYGFGSDFESRGARFLVSRDGGRRWERRAPPEAILSLAIDPGDPRRVVVAGETALFASRDAGRTWRRIGGDPALLAWAPSGALHALGADGAASVSRDRGATWRPAAPVGGPPAALEAAGDVLLAALHDGTVKESRDGGASWTVRAAP